MRRRSQPVSLSLTDEVREITVSARTRERSAITSSIRPSAKYAFVGVGAQVRERQHHDGLAWARPAGASGASGASSGGQELQHVAKRSAGTLASARSMARRTEPGTSGAERRDRRHRIEQLPRQHRGHGGTGERRLTRQQLVEDAGEAVLVGPGIDLAVALGLLGAHVGGGSQP